MKFTNLKPFIIALAIGLLLHVTAFAQDRVDVISPWGEGGMAYAALENLMEYDNEKFNGGVDVLGNCAAVANYMEKTNKPTVTVLESIYLSDSDPCHILSEKNFITSIGIAYWNFCRLPSDTDPIEELLGNARIGYYNGPVQKIMLEEIISGIGSDAKAIPYPNQSEYKAAIQSEEIDYVFTPNNIPDYNCVLTANPNHKDIENKLVDMYDGTFAQTGYTLLLLGANVDKKDMLDTFISSSSPSNSNLFITGLGKNYDQTIVNTMSTEDQLNFFKNQENEVRKIFNQKK